MLKELEQRVKEACGGIVKRLRVVFKAGEGETEIKTTAKAMVKATEAMERLQESTKEAGKMAQATMRELTDAGERLRQSVTRIMKEMEAEKREAERRKTNNWRRMHGLPMKRRCRMRKKKKKG